MQLPAELDVHASGWDVPLTSGDLACIGLAQGKGTRLMYLLSIRIFAGSAAAFALCMSPTMAAAATSAPAHSISPLVAVSVFGTQASAQEVCNPAIGAAAAGAAAVAQGQAGCVLPATDAPPPPVVSEAPPPLPPTSGGGLGMTPILLGLLGLAALAALIASGNEDSDSPVSPS